MRCAHIHIEQLRRKIRAGWNMPTRFDHVSGMYGSILTGSCFSFDFDRKANTITLVLEEGSHMVFNP